MGAQHVLHVSHHLFYLVDRGGTLSDVIPPMSNGLADPGTDGVAVHTGIHTGLVTVAVDVRDAPPEGVDFDWDEIVEVSLYAPVGQVRVSTVMSAVPDTFPLLTSRGAGAYRVRVHASGRDTDIDGVALEPFESYLIQVWQGEPAVETIYKQGERCGAGLRQSAAKWSYVEPTPSPEEVAEARRRAALDQNLRLQHPR